MPGAVEIAIPALMNQSRSSQLAWLEKALEKTGWSIHTLAAQARVNASTLYRFQSGENEKLRPVTINRIAKVARVEPPAFGGLSSGDAREYDISDLPDIETPGVDKPHLIAVKMTNEAMALAGVNEGDFLVVDRRRKARPGDIVCAQQYDFRLGGAETIVRYFEPPYLVSASGDAVYRRPILIDDDKVQITGVVIRQIRVREFPQIA